ncbi:hypothetical protein BYT27DRAFT_7187848 [Phlegmacium glaucopus]|nr:hypothetical protein BYT27DRAFT_7187848 [Phlegmacium glaucopus]
MHEWLHFSPVALFADIAFARLKRDDNTHGAMCQCRKHGDYSNPAEIVPRSVLIPDSHGSEYVVSHSRRPVHGRRRRPRVRMLRGIDETPLSRRGQDAIPGNVALVSPVYGSSKGRQIATLFAAPKGGGTWTLYASETQKTEFLMVKAPSMESTSDLTPVTLQMGAPGETPTCATYNSNPPQGDDEYMTMEPCANRANPEMGNKSQIFMYNGTSNTLEPSLDSGADGADTAAAGSPVNQNSTTLSNATATSSAITAAATLFANREDIPLNPTAQNSTVTLVFAPANAMAADVGTQENPTTAERTMTMTKTVTVFNAESTSAGVSSSTSNAAAQGTSSALDVQLVGAPIPSSAATGTTAVGLASVSTSSNIATRSIDAAAIASRIAASASASAAGSPAATTLSPTTDSMSPKPTQTAQRRANGRLAASDSKFTALSTEPYTWMFKAEEK